MDLSKLYDNRFADIRIERNEIWRILCQQFFQKFVPRDASVLDVGSGDCEFINNIRCARKYAVDLNARITEFAGADVTVILAQATRLQQLQNDTVDVVFMSNLLEHMASKDEALESLKEALRVLRPGGKILILQPNVRFAYAEYWDFWDHHIPISDRSLCEALVLAGFKVETVLPRFLPYTTKSRIPKAPFLVKLYLHLPFLWRLFGKQTFVLARKVAQPTCALGNTWEEVDGSTIIPD